MVMTNPEKNHRKSQDQNYVYNKNGHRVLAKGNQIGRIKKRGYTILDLTKVALQYDKTHDETILKHYIEQLLKDNRLLENFINKYVPTKNISELTGAGGEPFSFKFIIERYEDERNQNKTDPQTD